MPLIRQTRRPASSRHCSHDGSRLPAASAGRTVTRRPSSQPTHVRPSSAHPSANDPGTSTVPGGLKDVATLPEHITVVPIGYIMEALFPAPGGVGGGEAIFGWLYTLLGKPVSVGVAGRLTMRMVQWTLGLIGYVAYLRMRAELPVEEAEAAEDIPDPIDDAERTAAPAKDPAA